MFAKIFEQIFDSSLANNWKTRVVFEDMLVLADINGVVDKTHEAISRRTNVPLEIVVEAIKELESPDPQSRRPDDEGRRLVRLDDHRNWGWIIVNYAHYRKLASEEQRRAGTKDRVSQYRALKKEDGKEEGDVEGEALPKRNTALQGVTGALQEPEKPKKPKKVTCLSDNPPTIEEIKAYLAEKEYTDFDAELFYDKMVSKNWRDKNDKPLYCWKAVIRTWRKYGPVSANNPNRALRDNENDVYEPRKPKPNMSGVS